MTFEREIAKNLNDKIWVIVHRDLRTLLEGDMVDRIARVTQTNLDHNIRMNIVYQVTWLIETQTNLYHNIRMNIVYPVVRK